MYDRPNLIELIDAARLHMQESIAPAVRSNHKLYFQTLVAINVLHIAMRELQMADSHTMAAWAGLNRVEDNDVTAPLKIADIQAGLAERNATLSADIRAGKYDGVNKNALFEYLKGVTVSQLEVANPRFLKKLAEEDANPELDAWHNR